MKYSKLSFLIILILICSNVYSQSYFIHKYGSENGLSSNLTKALNQDNMGFIWVATDAGIARFDGKQFINIAKNLPSLFVKDVLITHDNKIIVATDLGVGYIVLSGEGYEYKSIIKGHHYETAGYVYYPKALFEDSNKNIWISDNTGLIQIKNGKFKKYRFEDKYATDDYLNSFWLSQDNNGRIIASSWQGYLFYFDEQNDRFVEIPIKDKKSNFFINQLAFFENHFIAATSQGLLKITINDDYTANAELILSFVNTICFYKYGNKYFIGGVDGGIFLWDGVSKKASPIAGNNINSIVNFIFGDKENNIWACTDEGVILLQKTAFSEYFFAGDGFNKNSYIRTICSDGLNNLYFTDQENIFKISNSNPYSNAEKVFDGKGKRIYNFAVYKNNLWVSTRSSELILKSGKTEKRFTIPNLNFRISGMAIDTTGTLWGLMEHSDNLLKISPDFSYKIYKLQNLMSSEPLIKNIDDKIYILSFQDKLKISTYDINSDSFVNLQIKHNINYPTNIAINDFVKISPNNYLIATNIGILQYKDGVISYRFGKNHSLTNNAKAIKIFSNHEIWIGTEKGLTAFYINEFAVFNRADGLPNSVITPSGLYVDNNNKIWVATSSGLAYWQKETTKLIRTPKPIIYSAVFKGKILDISGKSFSIKGKGTLIFNFSALVYPANKKYQYRLLGFQDEWSDLTDYESLSFINLPKGNYVFQVRAKQSGYLWSDISSINLTVIPPWYLSDFMVVFYFILGIIFIIFSTLYIQKNRVEKLKKQKAILQALVEEKVKDLKKEKEITEKLLAETESYNKELKRVNSELVKANEFKSEILGIAAHDLKNPLGTILSLSDLLKDNEICKEDKTEMISLINSSALRMLNLITDLLESIMIENTKFKMNIGEINLTEIVDNVVKENRIHANKKGQTINFNNTEEFIIQGDKKWIREIIDNLISNAVKYTPQNKNIFVDLSSTQESVILKVKDEGQGFTEQDKASVFQKFKKLSARPTGGESSTGLGLAIVKELVDLHHGDITLISEPGKGSEFIVTFQKVLDNYSIQN